MSLLDSFLARASLAGLGLALAAGPLGCFIVWRRMAYFGDATAHAAILGVALALGLSMPVFPGVLIVAATMAVLIVGLQDRGIATDTLLGVLAHAALAVGLVAVSFVPGARLDLGAYLFGDILAVGRADLALIWGGTCLVLALLAWRWQNLLAMTLDPDIARSAGIDVRREELILTLTLALIVAVSIKVVGALLVTALLIIPAATARAMARSPEGMAAAAALIGTVSALGGIRLSYLFDTPTGPSIVSLAAIFFAISAAVSAIRSR